MATSASQTYIAKLGFQDKDRGTHRHGLACEYLFERLLELETIPYQLNLWKSNLERKIAFRKEEITRAGNPNYYYSAEQVTGLVNDISRLKSEINELSIDSAGSYLTKHLRVGECVNVPVSSGSYVNGFADVLISLPRNNEYHESYVDESGSWLGEVKITKEPAENILQQINFYLKYIKNVKAVYILTDYDPSDLQRLCVGTKIKVFQLGSRFEQWISSRVQLATDEL